MSDSIRFIVLLFGFVLLLYAPVAILWTIMEWRKRRSLRREVLKVGYRLCWGGDVVEIRRIEWLPSGECRLALRRLEATRRASTGFLSTTRDIEKQ